MAFIKTEQEIEKMRQGGKILSQSLEKAVKSIDVGISLFEIDAIAESEMRSLGAKPSFKGYQPSKNDIPFPSTVCLSINQEIVHGIGTRKIKLKEGDVLGLDIGCWYEGLCTDMAMTVVVGKLIDSKVRELLDVTKKALMAGVDVAIVGNDVRDISFAIESVVQPFGFGNVRSLVGHGVGHAVHENPLVPNFVSNQYLSVPLQHGMCLALEPMFGLGGDHRVKTAKDGWAIELLDGSIGSHFEVTIAILDSGTEILTPLPQI